MWHQRGERRKAQRRQTWRWSRSAWRATRTTPPPGPCASWGARRPRRGPPPRMPERLASMRGRLPRGEADGGGAEAVAPSRRNVAHSRTRRTGIDSRRTRRPRARARTAAKDEDALVAYALRHVDTKQDRADGSGGGGGGAPGFPRRRFPPFTFLSTSTETVATRRTAKCLRRSLEAVEPSGRFPINRYDGVVDAHAGFVSRARLFRVPRPERFDHLHRAVRAHEDFQTDAGGDRARAARGTDAGAKTLASARRRDVGVDPGGSTTMRGVARHEPRTERASDRRYRAGASARACEATDMRYGL